ncbi:MAG: YbgC/FadM family acyl-CoA thioesterase [Lautropia sp.]|nr:YbgC/FadM family acyl-CoA thioesterase [Lautropia sp.]
MKQIHSIDVRIYYEDTDAGGIVYYANYLKFFERSRSDWLRASGIDHQRLAALGLGLVVRSCSIDYRHPAKLDDLLAVDTCIEDPRLDIRRASIRLRHLARLKGSGDILATGQVRVACVRLEAGRPAPMPDDVVELLLQSANAAAPSTAGAG